MDNKPFYENIYHVMVDEVGPIDTFIGLALGATVCGIYWRYRWSRY